MARPPKAVRRAGRHSDSRSTITTVQAFRRRLFAGVSVLSLILCLATVGLWVRSYGLADALYHKRKTPDGIRTVEVRSASAYIDCTLTQLRGDNWSDDAPTYTSTENRR